MPAKSRFHPYFSEAARMSENPCAYASSLAANMASRRSSTFIAWDSASPRSSE